MAQPNNRDGGMHAFLPGLILVGIGALFLLDNLRVVRVHNWFGYWPVILIAVGLVQLVDADHSGRRITGAVLMALGGLFLADNLGYIAFRVEDLWPLILIGVGLLMLWHRAGWGGTWWGGGDWRRGWHRDRAGTEFTGNRVHEFAIFSGSRRIVTAHNFEGGHLSVVFGGISLDLTGAGMAGNVAELNVAAIYGGISIRIPTTWTAEVRGVGIFGSFVDNSLHPPVSQDARRLIVKGAALFGGVTIKN